LVSISWSPAYEGRDIVGSVFSDSGPVTISGVLYYTFTGPGLNAAGALPLGVSSVSGSYPIFIPIDDNSVVGDGNYTIKGNLTINGQAVVVNRSGAITDNDYGNFSINLSDKSVAYYNISRLPTTSPLPANLKPDPLFYVGSYPTIPPRTVMLIIESDVQNTTSLAEMTYQFFTGKTPSLAGLDFLVSPTGGNGNNLNSTYYRGFNLENRYINFAVNLGLHGEGATKFASDYGSLSVNDAIRKAYIEVIGWAYEPAISSIQGSVSYFQQVARERAPTDNQDLATKAAAIGYLIEEAVKGSTGVYARALQNFYLDFADGTAQHNVSLLGTYGYLSFVDSLS